MIIVFLSIAAIAASTWAITLLSKNRKLVEAVNDKSSVAEALKHHVVLLEQDLSTCRFELKTMKSTIQSLNDKAKAAKKTSTPKVATTTKPVKEVATMSTSKRTYKKKEK